METASPFETAKPSANRVDLQPACSADVFLETLRAEQYRFLDVVGRARSLLGSESGQLSSLSALHCRLTRQFFDAQRSILISRAEVDAEVARITREADENAEVVVAAARSKAAEVDRVLGGGFAASTAGDPMLASAARHEKHSQRPAVTDSFAQAIDEVFQPAETDGVAAQRQLAVLVDEWWSIETREGDALIDDAHARAAVRQHRAEVAAAEILASAPVADEPSWIATKPGAALEVSSNVRAFLDAADSTSIESLLTTLTEALEPSATSVRVAPRVDAMKPNDAGATDMTSKNIVIRLDRTSAALPASALSSEEAFRNFWARESKSGQAISDWGWVTRRVLLPVAVATAGLAGVMVWMG